jgi:hypothetical protein
MNIGSSERPFSRKRHSRMSLRFVNGSDNDAHCIKRGMCDRQSSRVSESPSRRPFLTRTLSTARALDSGVFKTQARHQHHAGARKLAVG